jgi:hypothetical protein
LVLVLAFAVALVVVIGGYAVVFGGVAAGST